MEPRQSSFSWLTDAIARERFVGLRLSDTPLSLAVGYRCVDTQYACTQLYRNGLLVSWIDGLVTSEVDFVLSGPTRAVETAACGQALLGGDALSIETPSGSAIAFDPTALLSLANPLPVPRANCVLTLQLTDSPVGTVERQFVVQDGSVLHGSATLPDLDVVFLRLRAAAFVRFLRGQEEILFSLEDDGDVQGEWPVLMMLLGVLNGLRPEGDSPEASALTVAALWIELFGRPALREELIAIASIPVPT